MRDAVRFALKNIVASHGGIIKIDQQRIDKLENVLHEYRGEYWPEISVLIAALQTRIVSDLIENPHKVLEESAILNLANKMYTATGISEEFSYWAVVSWSEALGKTIKPPITQNSGLVNQELPHSRQVYSKIAPIKSIKTLPLTLAPGIILEFINIPAGEFWMGSSEEDPLGFAAEKPYHQVNLDEYWISRYPLTVEQYVAFTRSTSYPIDHTHNHLQLKRKHPVSNINWYDAVAFCRWASQATGKTLRLPSEAEWEKAARGSDGRTYPWGDYQPDPLLCNYDNILGYTTPVGQFSPAGDSPYGCAEMAGNVWEWTNSLCYAYPYVASDGRETAGSDADISASALPDQTPETRTFTARTTAFDASNINERVLRGGSFNYKNVFIRCAVHVGACPDLKSPFFGFRVAFSTPSA